MNTSQFEKKLMKTKDFTRKASFYAVSNKNIAKRKNAKIKTNKSKQKESTFTSTFHQILTHDANPSSDDKKFFLFSPLYEVRSRLRFARK